MPPRRGPRAGICLDLDHLDREALPEDPQSRNITDPLMPVMVETAPDLSWAWIAWHRNDGDLLVTVVDGISAGWHIRYSYAGHRMMGFEILTQADDVIADHWPAGRLPNTTA